MSHDLPSPGPWHTDHEHEYVMVFDANKIALADCAPYYASPYQSVCEANARLICAAPLLLAVLKDVEWAGLTDASFGFDGEKADACPWCAAEQHIGLHHEGCQLHIAIKLAEGRT